MYMLSSDEELVSATHARLSVLRAFSLILTLFGLPLPIDAVSHELVEQLSYSVVAGAVLATADIDRDGDDEIIEADSMMARIWSIASNEFRPLGQCNPGLVGRLGGVADVDGDGRGELLWIAEEPTNTFWLRAHPLIDEDPRRLLLTSGPYLGECNLWNQRSGQVEVLAIGDLDADARGEIYLAVTPYNPSCHPRRLLSIDGATGDVLWTCETGPFVVGVTLLPAVADQRPRAIVATFSPSNGFSANGMADSCSYVFSLNSGGGCEWCVRVGDAYSSVSLASGDLTGDGKPELLVGIRRGGPDATADERGTLLSLDPATGRRLGSWTLSVGVYCVAVVDLDEDGCPDPLVLGQDQCLYRLNTDLTLRWSQALVGATCLVGACRLEGSPRPSVICCGAESVFVVDSSGSLLAVRPLGLGETPSIVTVKDRRRLLIGGGSRMRICALRPASQPLEPGRQPGRSLAVAGGAGLALGTGIASWVVARRVYKRPRAARLVNAAETHDQLLKAMSAFSHGGASLALLDRARFLLKNYKRTTARTDSGVAAMTAVASPLEACVLPDLTRMAGLARRAGIDRKCWRDMVPRSVAAVQGFRQISASPQEACDRDVRQVLHDLEAVDADLQALRGYLRRAFQAHPVAAIESVLGRRRRELESQGIRVCLEVRDLFDRSVFAAPPTLEKILDSLVVNAIQAMVATNSEPGGRKLGICMSADGSHARVEVSDTGCGIPQGDWERIFDRDYTTKAANGGFGLFYAREELAQVDGRIRVADSVIGRGTIMRVVLYLIEADQAERAESHAGT